MAMRQIAPQAEIAPTRSSPRLTPTALGLSVIEALIGYEWLVSALDKILSADFRSGLAHQLQMNMQGNPNTWWVSFADRLMVPHAQFCAVLAEVGELLVALGFFAGAVLWISGRFPVTRWARLLNVGAILALVGGALMTANYYLMAGNTFPGVNPGDPFDEGLSLDGLLTLMGFGLLIVHLSLLWRRHWPDGPRSFS